MGLFRERGRGRGGEEVGIGDYPVVLLFRAGGGGGPRCPLCSCLHASMGWGGCEPSVNPSLFLRAPSRKGRKIKAKLAQRGVPLGGPFSKIGAGRK